LSIPTNIKIAETLLKLMNIYGVGDKHNIM